MTQLSVRTRLDVPQEWNLSDLYRGFDDPQLKQDLQALQQKTAEFRQNYRGKVSQLAPEAFARCLQQLEAISTKADHLLAFPSLVFCKDSRNSEAKQFLNDMKVALTRIDNQLLFFELELQNLGSVEFDKLLASPSLSKYNRYLNRIAQSRPHMLSEEVEQTRKRDNLTGRQALIQLHSVHLCEQDYEPVKTSDGKIVKTEAELEALLYHPEADVRYDAYRSVRQVMQQHNTLYGFILNTIAQDHHFENQMRGYPSTLQKYLVVDEVSEGLFRAIMQGTSDRFGLFQRYYQLKGEAIGQNVRTCDLYAPWTTSNERLPSIDYRTAVETLLETLRQFDVFYANRAEEFFAHGWVDAKVRAGKRRGECEFPTYGKHNYLSLSYTEDYKSMFALAHGVGHGLHFALTSDRQTYFNSKPPAMLAEVASSFNELLLLDYLLKKAGDDKHLRQVLLTQQLEQQLNRLFCQSTISRLELAIHERASQGSFDHNFVNEQWMEFYRELCGGVVEVLPEHQYDWARINSIFCKPFSSYQHTASNIVSLACYQKYQQTGKDFIRGYLDLLSSGGSLDQVDALSQYVGVDIDDYSIIHSALDYVEGLIEQLQKTL
ncbi:oligoendopeptidase F [Microcoleus sp. FACHB-SPT15]|uniref:M3 family oligoendopeptidase n=1 Tax=Microcoleus sp. FACHB-SPT15 TaxID=2692830 RepID=UPI001784ACCC|nr:M3 family metallopeptidase [Microcoleus sp. FACHB-SPT15]MBD1808096.1 oligoendopeptidase F [Microcoleus sp. FACHB-SPT15]